MKSAVSVASALLAAAFVVCLALGSALLVNNALADDPLPAVPPDCTCSGTINCNYLNNVNCNDYDDDCDFRLDCTLCYCGLNFQEDHCQCFPED